MERTKLEELIQAQLDGELSAAERAELARHLLQDAGARRLHDDYVRTDRLLRDIPAAEPPAGLREAILAGSERPQPARGSGDTRRWLGVQRIAAAIVGGLLIVGLAYVVSDGRKPGAELQGSLQPGRGPEIPGAAVTEFRASMRSEGVTVDALLRREDRTFHLELNSAANMPVEVAVRFDPSTTSFAGASPDESVTSADDEVTVRLPAGRESATLAFSGHAPVQLELRAGGRVLETAGFALSLP
jgi:anti-sigma factor RsiW